LVGDWRAPVLCRAHRTGHNARPSWLGTVMRLAATAYRAQPYETYRSARHRRRMQRTAQRSDTGRSDGRMHTPAQHVDGL